MVYNLPLFRQFCAFVLGLFIWLHAAEVLTASYRLYVIGHPNSTIVSVFAIVGGLCIVWHRLSSGLKSAVRFGLSLLVSLTAGLICGFCSASDSATQSVARAPRVAASLHGRVIDIQHYSTSGVQVLVDATIYSRSIPEHRARVLCSLDHGLKIPLLSVGQRFVANAWLQCAQQATFPTESDQHWQWCAHHVLWSASLIAHTVAVDYHDQLRSTTVRGVYHDVAARIASTLDRDYRALGLVLLGEQSPELCREWMAAHADSDVLVALRSPALHLAVLLFLSSLLASWIPWPRIRRLMLVALLIGVWFGADLRLSAERQLISAVLGWLLLSAQRPVNAVNRVIVVLFFLVIVDPMCVCSGGLWLSVTAAFSFARWSTDVYRFSILATSGRRSGLHSIFRSILAALRASLTMMMLMMPLKAFLFPSLSLVSGFVVILTMPILWIWYGFSFLIALTSPFSTQLATVFGECASAFLRGVVDLSVLLEYLDPLRVYAPRSLWLSVGVSLCLFWIMRSRSYRSVVFRTVVASLVIAAAYGCSDKPLLRFTWQQSHRLFSVEPIGSRSIVLTLGSGHTRSVLHCTESMSRYLRSLESDTLFVRCPQSGMRYFCNECQSLGEHTQLILLPP